MNTTKSRWHLTLAAAACLFLALIGCSVSSPSSESDLGALDELLGSGPNAGFAWNDSR